MRTRVLALVLALAVAGAPGCAKVNPVLVAADNSVHSALAKMDDEARKVCGGNAAPLLVAPCNDLRPVVRDALAAGLVFNESIDKGDPTGALINLMAAVGRVADKVKALPNGQTVQLAVELARVIAEAYRQAGSK